MRPVSSEFKDTQQFGEGATAGVAPSWIPNTIGWYVRLYGNYQEHGHAGLDIGCPVGTPIYAPADGTVIYAGWSEDLPGNGPIRKWLFYYNFGGILTLIQHKGWIGVIAHQSNNNHVKVGQKVKEGQLIGLSGDTKTKTTKVAPHVHIEAIVDLSYRSTGGLIYGRDDPKKYFGSAAIAPQGTTTPAKEKESEMPVTRHVLSKFTARHRLPKGKAYMLSEADDGTSANFAVGGAGHYLIHCYVRGQGLLPGQRIKARFLITRAGKPSGHHEQDIVGTLDGTFNQPVTFNRPVEAGTVLTCELTSTNTETAYVTGFGAEVATWKA